MERTAVWNGITFASFIEAANAARPHVNAAAGVYQPITVFNPDGSVYNTYTLGKAPPKPATPVVAPAPKADELAELRARVEVLEALVASLVSASLEAPKAKRGRKASVGVPFDDPLPQVG